MSEKGDRERRRLINIGEIIALAALVVSAFGVWISWKSSDHQGPTRVIEQRQPIPLTLRAAVGDDGRSLVIAPVEASHALESLTLAIKGAPPIQVGSDGRLDAQQVESALGDRDKESKGAHSVPVRITARYVEMGTDKTSGGNYRLAYRWEGGGLFGGHSVRLVSLSRA
jgi:hypothetical protein